MTAPTDIAALKRQLTDAGLTHGPLHDALAELERTRAERDESRTWLGAANNEFGSAAWDWPDLWRRIAQLKELANERRQRAETAEADRDRLAGELAEARAFIAEFAAAKIDALRQPPCHPEDELEPVVEASEVWAWQEDARAALNRKDTP